MILAIETATDICGVALIHKQMVAADRTVAEKYIHSERLLPLVDEVLRSISISGKDVDAVAVSIGPGSFTGLRIGLSTAKGLAMAWQKPMIAVPTLDALAHEFTRSTSRSVSSVVCPLIDAKRDEAFFCFYEVDPSSVHRQGEYGIARLSEIAGRAPQSCSFIGDGARKMGKLEGINGSVQCIPEILCSASSVGIIAEMRGKELSQGEYSTLEPLYLRDFVATQPRNNRAVSQHVSTSEKLRLGRT